jgi:hydroxypyruvate isomerase
MPRKLAANISLLFGEKPYLERPAAARGAGFSAIETWWPFGADPSPQLDEVDRFVEAVEGAGVELVACNLFAGEMPAGERGVISLPDRGDDLRSSMSALDRIAEKTGCRLFNALYGVRDERFDPEEQDAVAVENLSFAADAVRGRGGTILVEALAQGENGAYPLTSPAQVRDVIESTGRSNVRMLADVYHFAQNGFGYAEVLDDHLPLVAHVQIADAPGRNEPGTGEIDFEGLFRALDDLGYEGWVGAEYRPKDTTEAGLDWLSRFTPETVA